MLGKHFINGQWKEGGGKPFNSENPATSETLWQGKEASSTEILEAVLAAKNAFLDWSGLSFKKRLNYLENFVNILKKQQEQLTKVLSKETGKPLWEATTEISAMINKLAISVESYTERCKETWQETSSGLSVVSHKPHGVLAVFGPFNFPGHLPNGHIIPALLAGNTVVYKPSELTPWITEEIIHCWENAGLPAGVINLVQGGVETGVCLSKERALDGVLFTGSFKTGQQLSKYFAECPEKILALEMGGNNPLIIGPLENIKAAVYQIIQSAYITAGQRCTCARRLILIKSPENKKLLEALISAIKTIQVGAYTEKPEPFMGPIISNKACDQILTSYNNLIDMKAQPLVPLERKKANLPFLSPGLLDVTAVSLLPDEEIFGPLLQVIWVDNFEAALAEANRTKYGLAAGLLADDEDLYLQFKKKVRAGILNWNRAITGASSHAPFGGIGHSGNHRPSAYYAADYCAYPVAHLEEKNLELPQRLSPGLQI